MSLPKLIIITIKVTITIAKNKIYIFNLINSIDNDIRITTLTLILFLK